MASSVQLPNGFTFTGARNGWGQGELLSKEGHKWIGNFQQFVANGPGQCTMRDGRILKGDFIQGKLSRGDITYPNGITHSGSFENDHLNGEGTITLPSGRTLKVLACAKKNAMWIPLPAALELLSQSREASDEIATLVCQLEVSSAGKA